MATAEGARGLHPSMNWDEDDLIGAFQKFKQKADLCFKSFLKETTPEQKVSYILLWSGERGLELYNSWDMTDADKKKPEKILERFANHLEPKTNKRINRYQFQSMKQNPDESTDDFLTRLKTVAKKCGFGNNTDERIVDQLIWGCAHNEVQKSLVGKDTLTLKEAADTARAFEATSK
ncbi:hypothetical protein Bbelb_216510 [Branchiostoma belcheri]|nr:hypothetical protein Bbelb_216510 [Branchiostoma belcheri]